MRYGSRTDSARSTRQLVVGSDPVKEDEFRVPTPGLQAIYYGSYAAALGRPGQPIRILSKGVGGGNRNSDPH